VAGDDLPVAVGARFELVLVGWTIEALWLAIGNICDLFTPAECWNFFRNDGYTTEFT